jgi:DNA repair protein RadC
MAAEQSTAITPVIRVRPELILGTNPYLEREEPPVPLFVKDGNVFREAEETIVVDCARKLVRAKFSDDRPEVRRSDYLHDFLMLQIGSLDHEVFAMFLLDAGKRLMEYVELFHGTVDSANVYTREVLKYVLTSRAAGVVIAHNHPSGEPLPSPADLALTGRLKQALDHIDVRLHDHLIVGRRVTSLREISRLS